MGACTFQHKTSSRSMNDAYQDLFDESVYENGHDSYNGTISTTSGIRDVTNMFKRSKLSLDKFIHTIGLEETQKWGDAWGIEIKKPRLKKIKAKVDNIVTKGARKWETRYIIYDYQMTEITYKLSKGDAITKAKKLALKNNQRYSIRLEKHIIKSDNLVARVYAEIPKTEKLGEYVIFGWAAE